MFPQELISAPKRTYRINSLFENNGISLEIMGSKLPSEFDRWWMVIQSGFDLETTILI